MFKFLLFFILQLSLVAQTISFKEERYIDALENSVFKKGHITLNSKNIELKYNHSSTTYRYEEGSIYTIIGNKQTLVPQEQTMVLNIFFTLLKSIYSNNTTPLEAFFSIEEHSNHTQLTPKKNLLTYISRIEYKKNESLDYLKIYLPNNDWITIEPIH